MQVYNEATGATAEVQDKAFPMWAERGWVPVQPRPEGDEELAEIDTDVVVVDAEVTAEDTGRGRHPAVKANKDK